MGQTNSRTSQEGYEYGGEKMRLRTKFQDEDFDLGEVVECDIQSVFYSRIKLVATQKKPGVQATFYYNSLEELNEQWGDEQWEDVPEEPFSTSFYTIVDGEIKHCIFYRERITGCPDNAWAYLKDDGRERIKQLKEVGLYFETEEEAEKAVEKLKAWKRLRDKGFKFRSWRTSDLGADKYYFVITAESDGADKADLDICFGGEE